MTSKDNFTIKPYSEGFIAFNDTDEAFGKTEGEATDNLLKIVASKLQNSNK